MMIYFGEEVEKALLDYLEERDSITPVAGHENALFYSTQRKRIGVQAVKTWSKIRARNHYSQENHIAHKLQARAAQPSTRKPVILYLIADVLGTKTSIQPENIMQRWMTGGAGRLPLQ